MSNSHEADFLAKTAHPRIATYITGIARTSWGWIASSTSIAIAAIILVVFASRLPTTMCFAVDTGSPCSHGGPIQFWAGVATMVLVWTGSTAAVLLLKGRLRKVLLPTSIVLIVICGLIAVLNNAPAVVLEF